MIEIWKGGKEDSEGSVPLDADSLPYIRINLKMITKTYDESGKESIAVKKSRVGPCPESFFKSDYEKKFYKTFKGNHLLCVDDDTIYL